MLAQTVLPAAIIVADDCSGDDSFKIAESYVDNDKEVPIILMRNEKRQGTIENENRASRFVETPWMFFLDADDKVDPTYIEKVLRVIESRDDNLMVVYSDMQKFGKWEGTWVTSEWDPEALRVGNYINGHSVLRTDLFREIGMLRDTGGFEDHQMWVDMLDLNRELYGVRIPEALVWYRRHEYGHRTDHTDQVIRGNM